MFSCQTLGVPNTTQTHYCLVWQLAEKYMPYMRNGKRDYKRENALYNSRPEIVKKREERNKARAQLAREGKVHKGDGKDVDHRKPLSTGGSTSRANLRVVPASQNRSFSRNADGSLKSQTSSRERKRK